jgi:lipid A 4'-phosphatase
VPGQGFPLAHEFMAVALRQMLRIVMTLFPVATLVLFLAAPFGLRPWRVPPDVWAFVTLMFLVGPVLVVNLGLKDHWGRARPDAVTQFGGEALFTPALRIADQCAANCSFVSGEGAGATALGVAMVVLAPWVLAPLPLRRRRRALALALCLPVLAIVLRVAMGRHFLSDSVFAILIVLAIAAILHPLVVAPAPQPPGPHR